jgi:hypothetical protein
MLTKISLTVFFNQYVNPVALGALGWKYYIVYDCWIAVELAVVYFFYIEVGLEGISRYFDGADTHFRSRTHPSRRLPSTLTVLTPLLVVLVRDIPSPALIYH